MAWRGSFSRSFISTARASAFRSPPPPLSSCRIRPPSLQPRRLSFSNPRTLGELGCTQSLIPLLNVMAGARLTSHLAANARACCELYNGRNGKRWVMSAALPDEQWQDSDSELHLNILLDQHSGY